jgi:hypothetical protein
MGTYIHALHNHPPGNSHKKKVHLRQGGIPVALIIGSTFVPLVRFVEAKARRAESSLSTTTKSLGRRGFARTALEDGSCPHCKSIGVKSAA